MFGGFFCYIDCSTHCVIREGTINVRALRADVECIIE